MKILKVTHYFPAHGGGVEKVAGKIVEGFNRPEVTFTWIASDTDPAPQSENAERYQPVPTWNGLESLFHFPYPIWAPTGFVHLWREVKKADLIHTHDFYYLGNSVAFFLAKLQKKPVLITQHIGKVPVRNPLIRIVLWGFNSILSKWFLGKAEQVVFISRTVQDYFSTKIRFNNPPLFIPNGVDTSIFSPVDDSEKKRIRVTLGLNETKPILLFVGRFVHKKGLHVLQHLAKSGLDATWIFAGWGPLDPRKWELPQVRVFDPMLQMELAQLYRAADLLVLPSVGEGFPLVIQEALACGLPALVGEETAHAFPGASALLLHLSMDPKGLRQRWETALAKALSERMWERFRPTELHRFARDNWSWQTTVNEYFQLYCRLTSD